jgi:predicted MFS family arabinose efflux permease
VVGIATSMETVTSVLLSLVAGALADRWAHRRVLIATDLVRAALLVLLAAAVTSKQYPVATLYVVAFLLGGFRQLHDAAAGAALPLVVAKPLLVKANSRLSASESAGNTAGPALAGGLVAAGGLSFAFLADALSFVFSAAGVSRVPRLRAGSPRVKPPRLRLAELRSSIGEGLRSVVRDRPVLLATALVAAMNVVTVALEAQFVPYAKELLGMGAAGVGAYFALGGVTGVVASVVLGRASAAVRGDVMLLAVALVSATVGLAGFAPSHATAAIAFAGTGAGAMVAGIQLSSLRQHRFPVRMLGRIGMATRFVLHGSLPVAFIAGGWLARRSGPDTLFAVSASIGAAGVLACLLLGLGRVRILPESGADAREDSRPSVKT